MSEAIRNMLEAQVAQHNGAPAAAPENPAVNVASSKGAESETPETEVEERLDEGQEVQDTPEAETPEDGVEPETPETEEPDDSDAEAEEDEGSEEEGQKKTRAEKRIQKLLHQRKKAESELEKAQQRIQELEEKAQAGPESPVTPSTITSMEEVDNRRLQIRDQLRAVNKYIRDGGYTDPESGDTIEVDELEKLAVNLEDERDLTLPKVADGLRERERIDREKVAKLYPDLLDEDSDAFDEAEEVFAAMPFLRTHPEGRLWVGRMLKGKRLERAPAKKSATPAQTKTKSPEPPKEPGNDGAVVRTSVQPLVEQTRQQELMSRLVAKRKHKLART